MLLTGEIITNHKCTCVHVCHYLDQNFFLSFFFWGGGGGGGGGGIS